MYLLKFGLLKFGFGIKIEKIRKGSDRSTNVQTLMISFHPQSTDECKKTIVIPTLYI